MVKRNAELSTSLLTVFKFAQRISGLAHLTEGEGFLKPTELKTAIWMLLNMLHDIVLLTL